MLSLVDARIAVVVPNWNGVDALSACLDSLLLQTMNAEIIIVENGSTDGSNELLKNKYPQVTVLAQAENLGFAGGVNAGIRYAVEKVYDYVALFNNDAVAAEKWLEALVSGLNKNPTAGIATCTFADIDEKHLDSTGENYTIWGLPYPRGRGEKVNGRYDQQTDIFGASGGASLYRVSMLKEIGLFDEDFFAYYEDVDISFRAQLAGWKVKYVPESIAYHKTGTTSSKIKGFTTYQTMKNLPLVYFKNVPRRYLFRVGWRFLLAYKLFLLRAISRGQIWPATKGYVAALGLLVKKFPERWRIQKSKKVSDEYIWSILTHDLPPNAQALRKLRTKWRQLTRRPHE